MAQSLAATALLLSPVFLWRSGLPQVSHLVLALALVLRLVIAPRFSWERYYASGVAFVGYTFAVSTIVYLIHGDAITLLAPLYYSFGLGVFLLLTTLISTRRKFLNAIFRIHVALLFIGAGALVLGVGRYFGEARYMGAFNDPNQMANWVLWAAIIVGVSGKALYGRWLPGALAMVTAGFLILFTASRSGLLGFVSMVCVYLALLLTSVFFRRGKRLRIRWALHTGLAFLVILAIATFVFMPTDALVLQGQALADQLTFMRARILAERDLAEVLVWRGYDRLWLFPEYLVLGSGEGANSRFATRSPFIGEIHSSWAGVLFSYGIIGFGLLCGFLWGLLRHVTDPWVRWMFVGPFMYGLATYSIRNWYFWVGIAVLSASAQYNHAGQNSNGTCR